MQPNVNPDKPEDRVLILDDLDGGPFTDPGGRLHVNVASFAEYFAHRPLDVGDEDAAAALKDLDFERLSIQQRLPKTGRNRKLNYWRAPPDFDWESEE